MSRRRVVVDHHPDGRAVWGWEDSPGDAPQFGFMEPAHVATIERAQATPEQLAVREDRPYLVLREPAPPPEAPPVTPELAARLAGLSERIAGLLAADRALAVAQAEVAGDLRSIADELDPPGIVPHPDVEPLIARTIKPAKPGKAKYTSTGVADLRKAQLALRVMAAVEAAGGDTVAAARALGMRGNAVTQVMRFAPTVLARARERGLIPPAFDAAVEEATRP